MTLQWTTEQIISLSPDDASTKAGKGLASKKHWVSSGRNEQALWGECQGSGSKPYQTQIDLSEPAFKCSCPSRKFPCKHGLGLFLMAAGDAASVAEASPPDWVTEWLSKRTEKAEKKEEKKAEAQTPEAQAKAAADAAKRAAAREKKAAQGLEDLDLWMRDLVRQGFGSLPSRGYKFWDEMAARMVDAQVPGVGRMLKEMGSLPNSGEGWQERLLERLGLVHLLVEGYRRIESLPEPTRADIRAALGFNLRTEEVLESPAAADTWHVLGQRIYDEDQLKVQRVWLSGEKTGQSALILNFAHVSQPLDMTLVPGTRFDAELCYYPGSFPLRVVIKERKSATAASSANFGHAEFSSLLSSYADALAANPWIEVFPAPLSHVSLLRSGDRWFLQDSECRLLPIAAGFEGGWKLLAMSGGYPLTQVFGEWNGATLLPLTALLGSRWIVL